jgi:hypothetical protein
MKYNYSAYLMRAPILFKASFAYMDVGKAGFGQSKLAL